MYICIYIYIYVYIYATSHKKWVVLADDTQSNNAQSNNS